MRPVDEQGPWFLATEQARLAAIGYRNRVKTQRHQAGQSEGFPLGHYGDAGLDAALLIHIM
jgi:hypothetical protein